MKTMRWFRSVALLAALATITACGEQLTLEEVAAMDIGQLESLAVDNNADAKIELAARYANGKGVAQDGERALALLDEAIAAGKSDALFFKGAMYHAGQGIPANPEQAVYWYEQAANKGNAQGQFWLAHMIGNGLGGIEPNWPGAAPILEKAAQQGHSDAQFTLGWLYETGAIGEADYEQAAYWYRRAIGMHSNQMAQYNLLGLIAQGHVKWEKGDPGQPPADATAAGKEADSRS